MKKDNTTIWVVGGLFGLGALLLSRKGKATKLTTPFNTPKTKAVLAQYEPYRITTRGANPWTPEGLQNVRRLKPHVDNVLRVVGGQLTSMFRSPAINKAVGGKANSPHLKGRALDLIPTKFTVPVAVSKLWVLVKEGKLGPVAKITPYLSRGYLEVVWR